MCWEERNALIKEEVGIGSVKEVTGRLSPEPGPWKTELERRSRSDRNSLDAADAFRAGRPWLLKNWLETCTVVRTV